MGKLNKMSLIFAKLIYSSLMPNLRTFLYRFASNDYDSGRVYQQNVFSSTKTG